MSFICDFVLFCADHSEPCDAGHGPDLPQQQVGADREGVLQLRAGSPHCVPRERRSGSTSPPLTSSTIFPLHCLSPPFPHLATSPPPLPYSSPSPFLFHSSLFPTPSHPSSPLPSLYLPHPFLTPSYSPFLPTFHSSPTLSHPFTFPLPHSQPFFTCRIHIL